MEWHRVSRHGMRRGDLVQYLTPGGEPCSGRYIETRPDGKVVVALSTGSRAIVPPAWIVPDARSVAPL